MYLLLSILVSFGVAAIEFVSVEPRLEVLIPYGIFVPAALCIPRGLYLASTRLRSVVSREWGERIEALLFAIIVFNAPASLWWHRAGFQYDRFLHFIVALCATFIAALVFAACYRLLREKRASKTLILTTTAFAMVSTLFVWEGFQWSVDTLFATHIFGDAIQKAAVDVGEDILFGAFGVFVASVLLAISYKRYVGEKLR